MGLASSAPHPLRCGLMSNVFKTVVLVISRHYFSAFMWPLAICLFSDQQHIVVLNEDFAIFP